MLNTLEALLGMLIAVAGLAMLAKRLPIPLPIVLVVGGFLLGFIPGIPQVRLSPEMVFLVLLPPLLYPAALFTPWRDFRDNLRPIVLLAVGLVLFTTLVVGLLAHRFIEGLPLAAAFVLGAIVSPPDVVAAAAITQRIKVPRRILTIVEGESLVNDATALVAYRFGVVAVVTGSFSLFEAGWRFVLVGLGGIIVGWVIGWISAAIQKPIDDPPIEITISLLTPFAAYLPAEQLGVSGVLAVVTAGLYHGWRIPDITTSRTRLQGGPVWEMIEFILNGFIFLLIGLQLPHLLRRLTGYSAGQLAFYGALVSLAVIVVRMLWIFPATYLPRLVSRKLRERDPYPAWQHVTIVGWTGIRGVVSLAAALSLPLTTQQGTVFPARDLIIFLTCMVILATLVVQGLSLPLLIRWLKVHDDGAEEREERQARLEANKAALARLEEIAARHVTEEHLTQRLRIEYEDRIHQLDHSTPEGAEVALALFSPDYEKLVVETLLEERKTILRLRNEEVINDEILRRIQRDIDLAEARLARPRRA